MKEIYEIPQMELIEFETEDIMTGSNEEGGLPFVPAE